VLLDRGRQSLKDGQTIREAALKNKVPYFTTAPASLATARAIRRADTRLK
jgi:carbamoyl-phosphate synthase large subunit